MKKREIIKTIKDLFRELTNSQELSAPDFDKKLKKGLEDEGTDLNTLATNMMNKLKRGFSIEYQLENIRRIYKRVE